MNLSVLDTSVVSLIEKKSPLLVHYEPHYRGTRIQICFQTVAELRLWALRGNWGQKRRDKLEDLIATFDVVRSTDELTDHWATIMDEARKAGRRLEAGDAWIAATALLLDTPLLTHDKDFDIQSCPSITVYRYAAP